MLPISAWHAGHRTGLGKKALYWTPALSSMPPCPNNQCYLQQLLCQHSLFCLLYDFYTLHTFLQELAISDRNSEAVLYEKGDACVRESDTPENPLICRRSEEDRTCCRQIAMFVGFAKAAYSNTKFAVAKKGRDSSKNTAELR